MSREGSPSDSPKRDGRRHGRVFPPQLDVRLQLSLSKESLDSGRESPMDLEPNATAATSGGAGGGGGELTRVDADAEGVGGQLRPV